MASPVSSDVIAAASINRRSSSSSGNPFTAVLMKRGRTPSTPFFHSAVQRLASSRAFAFQAHSGTPARFAAP
jgi:hypothetical protein